MYSKVLISSKLLDLNVRYKNVKMFKFSTHQLYPVGHVDGGLDGEDHDDVDGHDRQGHHCPNKGRQRNGGLEKEQKEEDEYWRMCGEIE